MGHPEELTAAIEKKFLEFGNSQNLTIVYAAGQGEKRNIFKWKNEYFKIRDDLRSGFRNKSRIDSAI